MTPLALPEHCLDAIEKVSRGGIGIPEFTRRLKIVISKDAAKVFCSFSLIKQATSSCASRSHGQPFVPTGPQHPVQRKPRRKTGGKSGEETRTTNRARKLQMASHCSTGSGALEVAIIWVGLIDEEAVVACNGVTECDQAINAATAIPTPIVPVEKNSLNMMAPLCS